jgi:carboxyl-terminal processing protease
MAKRFQAAILATVMLVASSRAQTNSAGPPTLDRNTRLELNSMLHDAFEDVRKNYYDPNLNGLDWNARYGEYAARLQATNNLGAAFRVVAAFLEGLKDSHTYFVPPNHAAEIEPGYQLTMVGNDCFVTQVRPKSDAESKLHVGDRVIHVNEYDVNRQDFSDIRYYFETLAPQSAPQFDLLSPSGERRTVTVNPLVVPGGSVISYSPLSGLYWSPDRILDYERKLALRTAEIGDVLVWKPLDFMFGSDEVDSMIERVRKHRALILDLRGNPGGSVDTLEAIVGSLCDHDVKIADRVGRSALKPLVAKRVSPSFNGQLIVLVDGSSGSAAEILARVVQLEHRGTVIGDRTAGAVMEARFHQESQGADISIFYGFSVTEAKLIKNDGQDLEGRGVVPDEVSLPTAADLAAGRDPVLAHAAELANVKLSADQAGKLFPYLWRPL